MQEVLRILGLLCLCINIVLASCPNFDSPDNRNGACKDDNDCSITNQCIGKMCCPRKFYKGVPGCRNGGDPELMEKMAKACNASHQCSSGFTCQDSVCCPQSYNEFTGPCKNGGMAEMMKGKPRNCTDNKSCSYGGYNCSNGFCCPTKFNSNICPKRGIPAVNESGHPMSCDQENPCNMSTYSCFNNTCCPTAVFSDMCPRRGVPMFDEDGSAIRCNRTKDCPGTTFACVPSGYCCPTTVFKDFCSNKGIPDIDEDGEAKMCNESHTCNNITHTCNDGYCCPVRIFSGACSNGGDPEMTDNKPKKCTEGRKGCHDGFSCREGTCCPAKVFTGFCPNGGDVETKEDRSARRCKPGDKCGSEAFSCQGGYCCPQKVAFKGPCPNGGMAEMDKYKQPRTCDSKSGCGGGYSCQNKHCCPSRVNDKICPLGGIPEKLDGGPRRCGKHNPCGTGYACIEKYCCPMKFALQGVCLGNGIPLIEDDVVKSCKVNNDCENKAYQCVNNHCCPKKFQAMGRCSNGGDPIMMKNGKVKTCSKGGDECGTTYQCESSMSGEEVMQCCPITMDQNMNLTDVCGKNVGPLMTRNGNSALLCTDKDKSSCPDTFYCKKSNKTDEQVCCPQAVRTKPGHCPAVRWDNATTCMSNCKTDADCRSYKICCASTCGLVCSSPVSQVKDGFCPSVPDMKNMLNKCLDQCSDDGHCEGKKKCCNKGCGNFCMDKMKVTYLDSACNKKIMVGNKEVILVANSSRLDSSPKHCKIMLYSEDWESHHRLEVKVKSLNVSDCDTSLTIYDGQTTDGSPLADISCATKTPKVLYSSRKSVLLHLSTKDSATNYNFVLRVKSVVDEKPGKCPAVKKGQTGICVQECSADKDCKDNQKCCSNGCGHVCTKIKRECEDDFEAVKTKLQTQTGKCTEVFIPRCDKYGQYSKTQCKDNTGECWCENGRHKINNTRIRGNPDCTRATKPGLCPPLPAALKGNIECVEKCLTDDNCNGSRSKCCFHGCGTICMAPRNETEEDKSVCPDGKPEKCCYFHQCAHAVCPAFPEATCRVNPCGGCSVQFFDDFDNEVNCTEGLSPCQIQAMIANQKKEDMTYSDSVKHFLDMVEREGSRDRKGIVFKNMTKTEDNDMSKEEICMLPAMMGPCKAAKLRYYYDTKSKKCEKFTYGGCDGNKNNFQDIKQCQKFCIEGQTRCAKPAFVGKCRASIPRWFYNVTAGKCETFSYGGCDADDDDNMFETQQTCMHTCGHKDACEKKKCPEGTKCISTDSDSADCVSTKKMPTLGHYVPKCLSNGSFSPVQCYQKSHVCWCVDDDGKPVPGSISVGSKPDCSGKMKNESAGPACENKAKPMVCSDSCHHATCGRRTDVLCRADPCDNCKVHFVDKKGNQVKCDMDMCKIKPPDVKKKPKYGCVNAQEMWYHDATTKTCKSFSYSKICHGKNMYFRSREECQDECLASACKGRGMNKSCDDTCAGKVCRNLAKTAHCVVDKCTCTANFRDRFTNAIVNCQKLPTTCQRLRAEEIEKNNKMKATSSKTMENPVPQCRDTGLFSPTQCDEQNCWCVGPTGDKKPGGQKSVSQRDDMPCVDDRVSEVIMKLRTPGDYDAIVKGREENFKRVCRQQIKKFNTEVEIALKDIRVMRGSIIILLVFEPNDEVPDPLSAAVVINDTVNAGQFTIEFEGKKLVVDGKDVSMEVMMSSQTDNNVPVTRKGDHDNKTVVIVVVVIVSLAAIAMIIAAVLLIKRKKAKDNIQFSSLEESKDGITNTMYFSNSACE